MTTTYSTKKEKACEQGNTLFTGDCLYVLNGMNSESVDLIYLDPPFNSKRFYSAPIGSKAAGASFKDMWSWKDVDEAYLERMINDYPYLVQFVEAVEILHSKAMMAYLTYMTQRILEMHRVLKSTGSLYLHCDQTASHYLKILLDRIFDKNNFLNEVIWSYDFGGRSKRFWPKKHDVLFWYRKSRNHTFNFDSLERIPYKGNIHKYRGNQEAKKHGKTPTDVWDIAIINTMSHERTGYPTQKPLALLKRVIKASSNKGDVVLDPFCGCATTMVAAQQLQRRWIGIDIEQKSAELVVDRLSDEAGLFKDFIHRRDIPQRTDIEEVKESKQSVKERLYKEQKGVCNGCENELEIRHLEIDHIIPRSKGGGDYYENYQLLCGHCNRVKGNNPMDYLIAKIAAREKLLKRKITFGKKST